MADSVRQTIYTSITTQLGNVGTIRGAEFGFPLLQDVRRYNLPFAWVYPLPEVLADDEDQATDQVYSRLGVAVEIVYRYERAGAMDMLKAGEVLLADSQAKLHTYQDDSTKSWTGRMVERQNDMNFLSLDDAPYGVVSMIWEVEYYRDRTDPYTQAVG